METASPTVIRRPELVSSLPVTTPDGSRALAVTAVYHLSETGRKASLLQGGDGHTVQRLQVSVPANRLHLVAVNARGEARLRLSPRFEVDEGQRIRRLEEPPSYDAPPTIDQLFKDAARNHELERSYQAERTTWRAKRRDAEREWRDEVAAAPVLTDTPSAPRACGFMRSGSRQSPHGWPRRDHRSNGHDMPPVCCRWTKLSKR